MAHRGLIVDFCATANSRAIQAWGAVSFVTQRVSLVASITIPQTRDGTTDDTTLHWRSQLLRVQHSVRLKTDVQPSEFKRDKVSSQRCKLGRLKQQADSLLECVHFKNAYGSVIKSHSAVHVSKNLLFIIHYGRDFRGLTLCLSFVELYCAVQD